MSVQAEREETTDERRAEAPVVAIVGRPNVGKSTLFNRILGERVAIVAEQEGVTRDRHFAPADWAGRHFMLVDTGGVVDVADRPLEKEVREQVMAAVEHADALIFVVDAEAGIHPVDARIADLLRRSDRPVILAANKVDDPVGATGHLEFYELGLGDPIPVSAANGKGSGDLLDAVVEKLPPAPDETAPGGGEGLEADLRLAVIGRPNVGKSSFVNRLLGEERVVVHEEPGTTRDSIDTYLEYEGQRICLVDTAGLRRQARIADDVEFYSRVRTTRAIDRADVCILLMDCMQGAANQDFRVGEQAWDAGCGLVFVANKWDLVEDRGPEVVDRFQEALRERASYLRRVPIVTTSAKTGLRVRKVLELARRVQENRRRRVQTSDVNDVLHRLLAERQPPQGASGDVRIYYGTQVASEPPLFVLWANRPEEVADHYVRYLENGFREEWDFLGTPVRVKLRRRDRPG